MPTPKNGNKQDGKPEETVHIVIAMTMIAIPTLTTQ